jgi:hypothetical protein
MELDLHIDVAADFADLFEVKDVLPKKGIVSRKVDDGSLVLGYRRETYVRETHIRSEGAVLDEQGLRYHVVLEPHGEWKTSIDVRVVGALERSMEAALPSSLDAAGARTAAGSDGLRF